MIWTTQRYDNWLRQEMDTLFNTPFFGLSTMADAEYPRVNVHSSDEEMVLTAHLPGVDPSSLDITCKDDTLTIRGVRKADPRAAGERYLRQERAYGEFVRAFSLAYAIDTGRIEAKYKDGVLTVRLPKQPEAKPKKIAVSVA